MAWYENCPPDVELVSVATLDSIFEMEQFIPRLEEAKIPWRVVEHDSTILKDPAVNMGYATLYVGVGHEEKALALLKEHRLQQAAGRPCPSCGLWLGPNIMVCPACGYDLEAAAQERMKEKAERSGDGEVDEDEYGYDYDDEEIEEVISELDDNLVDLSDRVTEAERDIDELRVSIDELYAVRDELFSKIQELDDRIARLESLLTPVKDTEDGEEKED